MEEAFFLADNDVPTTADFDMTIIMDVVRRSYELSQQSGRAFPEVLRLHADNGSGELKNQTCSKCMAWMVWLRLFKSIQVTHFMAGHSHGLPDQRFSEVREKLFAVVGVLEDPADYMKIIEKVEPREGRKQRISRLHALYDFKSFFDDMEVKMSGHTQTQGKERANQQAVHSFSFVLREDYQNLAGLGLELESNFDEEPHPHDVIMMLKAYMSDDTYTQAMVFAPNAALKRLAPFPLSILPRKQMNPQTRKDLQKTIEKIQAAPWSFNRAADYLRELLAQAGETPQAPGEFPLAAFAGRIPWSVREYQATDMLKEADFAWARREPARVTVAPKIKATAAKKAASKKSVVATEAASSSNAVTSQKDDAGGRKRATKRPAAAMRRPAAAFKRTCAPFFPGPGLELPTDAESMVSLPSPPDEVDDVRGSLPSPAPALEVPEVNGNPPQLPESEATEPAPEAEAAGSVSEPAEPAAGAAAQTGETLPLRGGFSLRLPGHINLGCAKCRYARTGCKTCRTARGFHLEGQVWMPPP